MKNEGDNLRGQFPDSFFINGTMLSNTGVPGDVMLRFDRFNNAFSSSLTYRNTAFPTNVTETETYYYTKNMTYFHSTGNNQCFNQSMEMTLPMNFIDFIDAVWYHKFAIKPLKNPKEIFMLNS